MSDPSQTFSLRPALVAGVGASVLLLALLRLVTKGTSRRDLVAVLLAFVSMVYYAYLCTLAPYRNGDEIVNFTNGLVAVATGLKFAVCPHPTLYFVVTSGIYGIWTAALAIADGLTADVAYTRLLLEHNGELLVASRLLSALFFVAAGFLVYRVSLALTRSRVAAVVAMALFLGYNKLYPTQYSPYSMGLFFSFVACVAMSPLCPRVFDKRVGSFALGLLSGLAVGAHYISALILLPALVLWTFDSRLKPRALLVNLLAATLAFLASNPSLLLHPDPYLATWLYRIEELWRFDPRAQYVAETPPGVIFFPVSMAGFFPVWLAAIGAISLSASALLSKRRDRLYVLVPPLFYLLFFSLATTRREQYALFLLPFFAVACAHAVGVALRAVGPGPSRNAATVLLLALLSARSYVLESASLSDFAATMPPEGPLPTMRAILSEADDAGAVFVRSDYASSFQRTIEDGLVPASVTARLGFEAAASLQRPVGFYDPRSTPRGALTYVLTLEHDPPPPAFEQMVEESALGVNHRLGRNRP